MSTPKKDTKTEASIESLKFAHRWLFKVLDGFYEEQWATMMFDHGYRFAAVFAMCFPDQEKLIEDSLIKTSPTTGEPHNWFWMWWKLKWMQDDWEYINSKIYTQPVGYEQYKSYMLHCEQLEQDLLSLLKEKQIPSCSK